MSARPSLPTKAAALFGFSDILHIETFSTNESNINFWHVGIRHTDSLPKTGPDTLNPRPPLDAPVSRLPGDLRCWVAGLSRTRRRTRFDRDGRWCSGRRTQWQEWSARIGRVVPAVGIWSPCRIRGCERRRAPAPRSGYALDWRRQSGAEERGFAESDGALRDAMARGAQELRCSCRPVWPVDRPCARPKATRGIVLDMDSSVSPTHGEQEMSVWNGHYACTCYHPLFVFNQFGDLERCALRAGNVHSADGWDDVLKPVVARYQGKLSRIYFRADAAFAMPEVYEFLEAERIKYAIRLPANQVLQSRIGYLLTRPVGRPPHHVRRFHANF